jgi:hypothetical protein
MLIRIKLIFDYFSYLLNIIMELYQKKYSNLFWKIPSPNFQFSSLPIPLAFLNFRSLPFSRKGRGECSLFFPSLFLAWYSLYLLYSHYSLMMLCYLTSKWAHFHFLVYYTVKSIRYSIQENG